MRRDFIGLIQILVVELLKRRAVSRAKAEAAAMHVVHRTGEHLAKLYP